MGRFIRAPARRGVKGDYCDGSHLDAHCSKRCALGLFLVVVLALALSSQRSANASYKVQLGVSGLAQRRHATGRRPVVAVVSMNLPPASRKPYTVVSVENHALYAAKNDYHYFVLQNASNIAEFAGIRHAQNMKPTFIRMVLSGEWQRIAPDIVLWIDSDAVFVNCSVRLESVLSRALALYSDNSADIALSGDYNTIANTGVILMRNTAWTKRFIAEWEMLTLLRDRCCDKQLLLFDNSVAVMQFNGWRLSQLLAADSHSDSWLWTDSLTAMQKVQKLMDALPNATEVYDDAFRKYHKWGRTVTTEEASKAQSTLLTAHFRRNVAIVPQSWLNWYRFAAGVEFVAHLTGGKNLNRKSEYVSMLAQASNCYAHN